MRTQSINSLFFLLLLFLSVSSAYTQECAFNQAILAVNGNTILPNQDEIVICNASMVELSIERDEDWCGGMDNFSYKWYNGENTTPASTEGVYEPSVNATTTFRVTVEKDVGNCDVFCEREITIKIEKPSVTISVPDNQTPCEDDVIKLTANVEGGTAPYIYNWGHILGDNSDEGKTVDSKILRSGNRNHSVIVTDANGCENNTTTTVSFNPKPFIALDNVERFCPGGTRTLVASREEGAVCKWTFPNNAVLDECAFTVGEGDVGSYTVEVSKDGCTNRKDITIQTFVPDIPNLIEDQTECTNSGSFDLQVPPIRTNGTYSINDNPVTNNIIQNDQFYPERTAGAGTYKVEYLYTDGNGCSSTTTTTITLIEPRPVSFSELPTLCRNSDPINLMDFVSPKGGVFKIGSVVIDTILNPINSQDGNITYIYPNESSVCKVSMDKFISIKNSITFNDLTDRQICEGKDAIELKVENIRGGGSGSYTFNWTLEGANNDLLNPRNGMQTTLTSSGLSASSNSITASVTVGNEFAACKTTKSLNIKVFEQASLSIIQTPDNICSGTNIQLCASVTGGTGNINYSWNNGNNRSRCIDVSNVRENITNSVMVSFSNTQETGCRDLNADKTTIPLETPAPQIMMLPKGSNEICGNQQSIFVSTNQRSGSTFSWGYPSEKTDKVEGEETAVLSIIWKDFVNGDGEITVTERLPGGCLGTSSLPVVFNSDKVEDPAEVFLSPINNILIYNDDTVCDNEYQWGYIETVANGFGQDIVAEITIEGNPPNTVLGGIYQSYVASSLYNPNRLYWVSAKDEENCECIQAVLFDPRSSKNVLPTTPKFVLYPNPTSDRFRLEVTQLLPDTAYDIQIYNSLGQLLKIQAARTQNDVLNEEVDMSIYPSGVYHAVLVYKGAVLKMQSFILQP